jgi:TIR domain-containing protein
MDVFISWSGIRSKYVAGCLHVWLKQVIQTVRPWLSSEDILAGARWNAEIAKHLSNTKFGIICVTPENLNSAWLTFEAGALAKTIDERTFVCPYLIDLEEIDPQHPLSQFQCKGPTKNDTYDVVRCMYSALCATNKEIDLTEAQVKESFEQWWPRLDEQLAKIPEAPSGQTNKNQPDAMNELLTLVTGIARSVSELQTQGALAANAARYALGPFSTSIGMGGSTSPFAVGRIANAEDILRVARPAGSFPRWERSPRRQNISINLQLRLRGTTYRPSMSTQTPQSPN